MLWSLMLLGLSLGRHYIVAPVPKGTLVHANGHGIVMVPPGSSVAPFVPERNSLFELAMGRRISINQATLGQLQTVPHIGPVRASRIVENRRKEGLFSSISELQRVRGIGPRTIQKVAPYLKR